ncbi:MAG: tetratricopeptide repeat protein [Deltaproteobacteria bacterium]|nr:tetratricopeptide repeat protein [Deltaproteobacteria bacterium]
MTEARRRRGALGAALVAAALLASPAAAADDREQALALHDEAKELYAAGRYREAAAKLEEALEHDPEATPLYYNLAVIHEKLGQLDRALDRYRKCLELERDPGERSKLERTIARIEGALRDRPTRPPPAKPSVAAEPEAEPPAPGGLAGLSPWIYGAGASAGGALLLGTVAGICAVALHPGAGAATGPDVTVDDLRSDAAVAHGFAVVADVAVALGAAAGTATVVLYFTLPRVKPRPADAEDALRVELGPGRGQATWRF